MISFFSALAGYFANKREGKAPNPAQKSAFRIFVGGLATVGIVVWIVVSLLMAIAGMFGTKTDDSCRTDGNIDAGSGMYLDSSGEFKGQITEGCKASGYGCPGQVWGNIKPPQTEKVVHPVKAGNYISSPFGYRQHPILGYRKFHAGIDLPAPLGTPIYSPADGIVVERIDSDPVAGTWLAVKSNVKGQVTFFGFSHSQKLHVKVGDHVKAGQHIADMGTLGLSTGSHLHFEVSLGARNNVIDPAKWLRDNGATSATVTDPATGEQVPLSPMSDGQCEPTDGMCGGGGTAILKTASEQVGKPYVWGATGPSSFDCSGLVYYSYAQNGTNLGNTRTANDMKSASTKVQPNEIKPGDLYFCSHGNSRAHHVGFVYSVNPLKKLHAPSPGKNVEIVELSQVSDFCYGSTTTFGRLASAGGTTPDTGGTMTCGDGKSAESAKAVARSLMKSYGWGDDQWKHLEELWKRESSWDYKAVNKSSGAKGIPQCLPLKTDMNRCNVGEYKDYDTNPVTQIKWGMNYVKGRYGTPQNAIRHHDANNWY